MFKTRLVLRSRTKGSKPWSTAGSFSAAAAGDKTSGSSRQSQRGFCRNAVKEPALRTGKVRAPESKEPAGNPVGRRAQRTLSTGILC